MRHMSPEAPSAPQASRKLPSASRAPRVTPPRQPPNATPVPECLTRKPHPEALRVRHVFPSTQPGELPGCSRARHVSRVGRAPRAPPGSSPSGPCPENPSRSSPSAPGPRASHRETSRALGEHATCPRERLSSTPNLENVQKIDRTLEMHHKSNFDPKNAIPIFMALYCSVLPRKNTKPTEKTKLPLRKIL